MNTRAQRKHRDIERTVPYSVRMFAAAYGIPLRRGDTFSSVRSRMARRGRTLIGV